MPSLQGVLAGIPGLGGYAAGAEEDRIAQAAQLQQAGGLQALIAKARANQVAEQYRRQMAGAATDEERAAIAAQAAGPEGVLKHADTQARIKANQEQAAARLAQAASQWNASMALKMRGETRADALAALKQQDTAFKQNLARAAAQYNLPMEIVDQFLTTEPMAPAQAPVAPPSAPVAAPQMAPQVAPELVQRTTAPNEAAAMQQFREGGGAPRTVEIAPAAPVPAPASAPAAPNNLDARDLGAWSRAPAAAPAPTAPRALTIADAPAGLSPKDKSKWLIRQTGIAGGGTFNPQTLEFVAKQYLTGDRQAVQGFARNATARIALQNAIVDEAQKQRMSPEQVAAKIADFAGTVAGSRTVGQRAANISLAATEAQEMISIVKETSDKFSRTNFVPWNMALKAYESGTGSPEISEFGAAVNALVNVYARAINPTGVPTVSDKEHARAVINTVQSPAQVEAVLGIIRRELEIAKKAPLQVREATRESLTGQGKWRVIR